MRILKTLILNKEKINRLFAFILTLSLSFTLCELPVYSSSDGITIAGSTTILPISEKLAKEYKEKTGIKINVHGGGSTGGINATRKGTADIGASSRDLTKKEKKTLKEIVIGKDALAIIVHKSNPIENLTTEQARAIFIGRIKNWKEVGGPDRKIQIVNRESGSGTRNTFEEIVMNIMLKDNTRKAVPMSLKAVVNNSNAEVKETVKMVPGGIGYISVGFVDKSVKSLKINSVTPSFENIVSGEYSLVRNLYFLVKEKQNKLVKNFLRYVLSNEGQKLVIKEGFYPAVTIN